VQASPICHILCETYFRIATNFAVIFSTDYTRERPTYSLLYKTDIHWGLFIEKWHRHDVRHEQII